MEHLQKE